MLFSQEIKSSRHLKFRVKTKEPLSVLAWSRIKNSSSQFIKKNEMTVEQSELFNRLNFVFLEKLSKNGFKSINRSWRKSKTGYTLNNSCDKQKGCLSVWTFKLRVPSGLGHIYFTKKCNHVD